MITEERFHIYGGPYQWGIGPTPKVMQLGVDALTLFFGSTQVALNASGLDGGSVGFLQSGTGAVARTAQAKMRERVSLADFGGVGDGTTDDTTAINNAITKVSDGGEIYLTGRHLFSSKITVNKRIHFVGFSPLSTYATRTTARGFIKKSTMTTTGIEATVDGITFSGFTLDCEAGNTGNGIDILANGVRLSDVAVYGAGQDGIRVGDSAGALNCNSWYFESIRSDHNGRDGVRIDSASSAGVVNANAGCGVNVSTQNNTGSGVYLLKGQWNIFVGMDSESNTGYGLRLGSGAQLNTILGGRRESNTAGQVQVDASANTNALIGVPDNEIVDSGTSTVRHTGNAVTVGQNTGAVFNNGNGPTFGTTETYMTLSADAVERIRVGWKSGNPTSGLVTAQILADASILNICSRDTANAKVAFYTGAGLVKAGEITDGGKWLAVGGIGVGNSAAATVLGSVVKKMQVFDASGNSLGYVPIYNAIT